MSQLDLYQLLLAASYCEPSLVKRGASRTLLRGGGGSIQLPTLLLLSGSSFTGSPTLNRSIQQLPPVAAASKLAQCFLGSTVYLTLCAVLLTLSPAADVSNGGCALYAALVKLSGSSFC